MRKIVITLLSISMLACSVQSLRPPPKGLSIFGVFGVSDTTLNKNLHEINSQGTIKVNPKTVKFSGFCNVLTMKRDQAEKKFKYNTKKFCGKEAMKLERFIVKILEKNELKFIEEYENGKGGMFKVYGGDEWVSVNKAMIN